MDDIIKKLEKINPLIATEEDLLKLGASVPSKKEEIYSEPPVEYIERPPAQKPEGVTTHEIRDNDFQYMRENLYNIIETSTNALHELGDIAARSKHPRAYEVLSILIKTISDANTSLMKMHLDKANIHKIENKSGGPNSITNNNLFIGSTDQLDELCRVAIDKMKKKPDVIE